MLKNKYMVIFFLSFILVIFWGCSYFNDKNENVDKSYYNIQIKSGDFSRNDKISNRNSVMEGNSYAKLGQQYEVNTWNKIINNDIEYNNRKEIFSNLKRLTGTKIEVYKMWLSIDCNDICLDYWSWCYSFCFSLKNQAKRWLEEYNSLLRKELKYYPNKCFEDAKREYLSIIASIKKFKSKEKFEYSEDDYVRKVWWKCILIYGFINWCEKIKQWENIYNKCKYLKQLQEDINFIKYRSDKTFNDYLEEVWY